MHKEDLEILLEELDEALVEAFPGPEPIEVIVVGGACLLLSEVTSRPTKDIDVIITDFEGTGEASLVYQLTKTTNTQTHPTQDIGKRHGLPAKDRMFFNDDCALFLQDMGPLPMVKPLRVYQKLRLYAPSDMGYILATKLMSGRPDKDYEDIEVLCQKLSIFTSKQAQELVDQFFPSRYNRRIHRLSDTLAKLFSEE